MLGVCQAAKALRPDGKHAQCQPQNGPELPPSLCDCFLLQHHHQSLVNSHIRALCFHACPRSQGRQRRSFPSLGQARTESEHKGRRDHGSASWTKTSLLRQQDRQGLPRVSDRQPGSLWTTLSSPSFWRELQRLSPVSRPPPQFLVHSFMVIRTLTACRCLVALGKAYRRRKRLIPVRPL